MKRKFPGTQTAGTPSLPKAGQAQRKPRNRDRRRALLAALASLVLLIGGVVGLSALLSRLNAIPILSANAGSLALGLALTLACALLIALLRPSRMCSQAMNCHQAIGMEDSLIPMTTERRPSSWASVGWALLLGALAAGLEIGLFLLTGSARISHSRAGAAAGGVGLALWLDAGLALYPALWICGVLPCLEPARFPRLRRVFPILGAALEAGWLIYARGCTAWTFVLNTLLLGGLMYALAGRTHDWLPSAAGVFAFSAAARLFGEAALVYPVSEPFLTGAEAGGLFGSPVLTVLLLLWGFIALRKRARPRGNARKLPKYPTELGGGMR